jgi:multiple sugar transport system ATP-binding protein
MHQGRVQQIGAPYEVFFKPHNVFVAGFVGSPSMNMIDGAVHTQQGSGIVVQLPGLTQPAPERLVSKLRTGNNERVKWGIRPEHIKLTDGSGQNDVPGQIEVIEPLGSRQLLFVRVGECVFSVIEDATIRFAVGETCHLRFDEKNVHMFDADTGLSLGNQ